MSEQQNSQMDTNQDLRDRFATYLKRMPNMTVSAAARAMGISGSALSRWSNGKYAGSNDKIDAAVLSFLNREEERAGILQPDDIPFQETSIAKAVFGAARKAHLTRSMGLLVGPSGVGKTRCIREYALRNPDVILVECNVFAKAREVLQSIHRLVGGNGSGTDNQMLEDIATRLRGSGRLLILDEAESLRARTLDGLRRIHDFAGIGILYVGLDKFYHQLRKMNVDHEYVVNRIRSFTRLGHLTIDDTAVIAGALMPGSEPVEDKLHQASRGVARVLVDLCRDAQATSKINKIKVDNGLLDQIVSERVI